MLVAWQVPGESIPRLPETGGAGIVTLLVVFALLAALLWLLRGGGLGLLGLKRTLRSAASIEGTVPLGERRVLVIVAIEGRRLLLGVTPAQISLVTELAARPPFEEALAGRVEKPRGLS